MLIQDIKVRKFDVQKKNAVYFSRRSYCSLGDGWKWANTMISHKTEIRNRTDMAVLKHAQLNGSAHYSGEGNMIHRRELAFKGTFEYKSPVNRDFCIIECVRRL